MDSDTIKKKVTDLLSKNPLLKPLQLCRILGLDYVKHGSYVTVIRSRWKTLARNELGSNRLNFHHWRGYVYVPRLCDRDEALKKGWAQSKSKNRFLLWKSKLGRLMWFRTGRVNVWIRKPANKGRSAQLLADAFFKTYLIPDIRVFEKFLASLRFKGASVTVDLGIRLPYTKIFFLKKSNGVEITLGDLSHPSSIEIDYHYPDWMEQNEKLFETLMNILKPQNSILPDRSNDYRV